MSCPFTRAPDGRMLRRAAWIVYLSFLGLLAGRDSVMAGEPLHARVDRLIAEKQTGPPAARIGDAEFIRRVYLDLNGTIPSAVEARAFLDDSSPKKREQLIDQLLNNVQYARHMADVFDVMLMERRSDSHVKKAEWKKYLQQSFAANKPYNQLAREILEADGVDPKKRPAARFYLDRSGEPNLITREVGRMFFGRDLQCAQCHDHPNIDDYHQREYYGLYAFFGRSYLYTDKKAKKSYMAEKAEGEAKYQSVFEKSSKGRSTPSLPGQGELTEPVFKPGQEYKVKPKKGVRPVPKYSRRERLAKEATNGSNRAFNRNIVNRLWAHMMGRGLRHPLDLHHPDNPPSHPVLLELLADEFAGNNFDVKAFLREMALSKTYQRSVQMPASLTQQSASIETRLSALEVKGQQLDDAATASEKAAEKPIAEFQAANRAVYDIIEELPKAKAAVKASRQPVATARQTLAAANKRLSSKQDIAKALTEASVQAQKAASGLAGVEELKKAVEVLLAQSKKLNDEVVAIKEEVEQKLAAHQQALLKRAAAKKLVADTLDRLAKAQKKVHALTPAFLTAERKRKAAQTAATALSARLEELKSLKAYAAAQENIDVSVAAVETARRNIEAGKGNHTAAELKVAQLKTRLTQFQSTSTMASQRIEDAKQRLRAQQDIAKTISEAIGNVELAKKALADSAELRQAGANLKARADQLAIELKPFEKALAGEEARARVEANTLAETQKDVTRASEQVSAAKKNVETLELQLAQSKTKVNDSHQSADAAHAELAEHFTKHFSVGSLQSLSPEQFAWASMQATGLVERQRAASKAELDKKQPLAEKDKSDAAKLARRAAKIEQAAYDKLKGNVAAFVRLFGGGAGQPQTDFFATVDQALFLANAALVRGWLNPGGGNLTDRLLKLEDPKALCRELYLSILTRRPTEAEIYDVAEYLKAYPKEKSAAVQEMAWALMTSTEFRFNH